MGQCAAAAAARGCKVARATMAVGFPPCRRRLWPVPGLASGLCTPARRYHSARFAGARQEAARMGRVDVWWGDARRLLPGRLRGQRIDFLFLDGLPREYLEYLQVSPAWG